MNKEDISTTWLIKEIKSKISERRELIKVAQAGIVALEEVLEVVTMGNTSIAEFKGELNEVQNMDE